MHIKVDIFLLRDADKYVQFITEETMGDILPVIQASKDTFYIRIVVVYLFWANVPRRVYSSTLICNARTRQSELTLLYLSKNAAYT